jgi:hypothetical protein
MKYPLPPLRSLTMDKEVCHIEYYLTRDYDDVGEAAEELPAVMSWLNYHFAECIELADRAKRLYKEEAARVYFELRNGGFETAGYGDKQSENALEKATIMEPTVQRKAVEWEAASKLCERIRGQVMALQVKLDLLRTSEATRRRIHEAPVSDDEVTIKRPQNQQDPE